MKPLLHILQVWGSFFLVLVLGLGGGDEGEVVEVEVEGGEAEEPGDEDVIEAGSVDMAGDCSIAGNYKK